MQDFSIHGVTLRVNSEHTLTLETLETRLAPYRVNSLEAVDLEMHIEAASQDLKSEVGDIPPSLRWIRSRPFWGNVRDFSMQLTDGASITRIDFEKRTAHLQLAEETTHDELFFSRTFLLLPVVELLRTQGFFYLHGSVVTREDRGILFLGVGHSGKSTTAAAMMKQGWALVADDNLLLNAETGKLFPLEQDLSLSPEVFEQLGLDHLARKDRHKLRLHLSDLRPDQVASHTKPTDIVELTQNPPEGFYPQERGSIFHTLVEENPLILATSDLSKPHAQALRDLLRNCRCFRFQTKHDAPPQLDNISSSIISGLHM